MRNEGQDESQAGLKICRCVNSLRRQILTTLMADSKGTKEPPDECKRRSEKAGWKLNRKQRSWHPVPSLHSGNSDRCYFLGLQKAMTNLDSVLKSRDITLLTKVHLVKPMVFPVVVYGCESWTIKKAVR